MSDKVAVNNIDANQLQRDFEEFANEFKEESDRAAVILGASKLDQLLGAILERYLLPTPSNSDQLFENNGPLGTFSAKINMCYRLGLIDAQFCKCIHLVRRIRNSFAHEIYGAKLSNGSHKDRVKSLVAPFKEDEGVKFFKSNYFSDADEMRANFSSILGLMIIRLDSYLSELKPVNDTQAKTILST